MANINVQTFECLKSKIVKNYFNDEETMPRFSQLKLCLNCTTLDCRWELRLNAPPQKGRVLTLSSL